MTPPKLFTRRVRGVRLVEIWAWAVLVALVGGLYMIKGLGWGERAEIAQVTDDIAEESRGIHLLNAEVAYLEQPERIARLSEQQLGMGPTPGAREVTPQDLPRIAGVKTVQAQADEAPPAEVQPAEAQGVAQ